MDKDPAMSTSTSKKSLAISTLALAIAGLASSQGHAYSFKIGEIDATLDSSISAGASWRLATPDRDALPIAEGGNLLSSNYDNGSLNFERGETFSKVIKGVHELELRYENFGAFIRGRYWYDFELKDESGHRRYAIPDKALDESGAGTELLDAFVWANFDLPVGGGAEDNIPVNLRYGRQVVSWGESTFIQHSINTINPVDVSTFHKPGAQIKEALLPVEMLYGSFGLTDTLSLEFFYQAKWEKTRLDSCNTFFEVIDYPSPGCTTLDASFGNLTEEQSVGGAAIPLIPGSPLPINTRLSRAADLEPDDDGQFGLALRYYAEWLNDTEFGLYYINYHSRRPMVGAYGADPAVALSTAGNGYLNLGTEYFVEFPENIHLYGVSFNTTFGNTALSGEFSFRPNQPIQKNVAPVLWAALDPLSPLLQSFAVLPPDVRFGDLTAFDPTATGEKHSPYERFPVIQGQVTMIQFIDQVLGAERLSLVAEAGFTRVNGAPSKDKFSMFGPLGGDRLMPASEYNSAQSAALGGATVALCGFVAPTDDCSKHTAADSFSWGYRLFAELEYSDVFSGVKLTPGIFFTHDVEGTTPFPVGNFVEDTKSVGLSLKADYLNKYRVAISYTNFFGGDINPNQDRDFASLSMSYNF